MCPSSTDVGPPTRESATIQLMSLTSQTARMRAVSHRLPEKLNSVLICLSRSLIFDRQHQHLHERGLLGLRQGRLAARRHRRGDHVRWGCVSRRCTNPWMHSCEAEYCITDPAQGSPYRTGPLNQLYGQYKRLAASLISSTSASTADWICYTVFSRLNGLRVHRAPQTDVDPQATPGLKRLDVS